MNKDLLKVLKYAATKKVPTGSDYSLADVNETVRKEFETLGKSINDFQRNKYDIFAYLIETVDASLPDRVNDALGFVAETKVVPQGTRAIFKIGNGISKLRGKKFITQVGLAGDYETFKLDTDNVEVKATAVGGAGTLDFEAMLDGNIVMSDIMDVITEGIADNLFKMVETALNDAVANVKMPAANKVSGTYDVDSMVELCRIAEGYSGGRGAIIYAPPEFIAKMGADAIVPAGTNVQGVYHQDDIDAIHNTGYIRLFRGYPIARMPQAFTDPDNTTTLLDGSKAYIFPTGKEKVVKVVMEGETQMYDFINRDNSIDINVYKKLGAAVITYNSFCCYENTDLS